MALQGGELLLHAGQLTLQGLDGGPVVVLQLPQMLSVGPPLGLDVRRQVDLSLSHVGLQSQVLRLHRQQPGGGGRGSFRCTQVRAGRHLTDSPLAELRLLANVFLEHFVVSLQQGVMFSLELLQLGAAALEALLALGQPGPQLIELRGQLLPARRTTHSSAFTGVPLLSDIPGRNPQ